MSSWSHMMRRGVERWTLMGMNGFSLIPFYCLFPTNPLRISNNVIIKHQTTPSCSEMYLSNWHLVGPAVSGWGVPSSFCLFTGGWITVIQCYTVTCAHRLFYRLSVLFGPLNTTKHYLQPSLLEYCCSPCTSVTCTSIFTHKLKASQNDLSSLDLSPFGTWLSLWTCSWQICNNCVMLSCKYGPRSLRNLPNILLNLYHGTIRHPRHWGMQCLGSNPVAVRST